MPWSKNDYPNSFKNLEESDREKAVSIANALLKQNHDDASAIRIALSQVKKKREGAQKTASVQPWGNQLFRPTVYNESSLVKVAGDYVRRSANER